MNPQRSYRAICPQCGAQVEFRSAASALAVVEHKDWADLFSPAALAEVPR